MRARALGHLPGGIPARVAAKPTASGHLPGGIPVTAKSKDESVDLTPEQRERFAGTSVKQDSKGYYCHTHRARSDSYPSVDAIPAEKIKFIESTGMVKTADDDQCPFCSDDGLPIGGHEYRCQGCGRTFPLGGFDVTVATLKTADANTAGVMVCLIPEEHASIALMEAADSTEDFDEQHITLLYLGSTEDCGGDAGRERLHRAVYDFAIHSGHDVLSGKSNGWGTFNNDGETVLVALWDIPDIAEFRAALKGSLANHGVPLRTEDHGFTPHQTMRYEDTVRTTLPQPVTPAPESIFTHVVISWGEEWSSVALESALDATRQQVAATLKTALDPGSRWSEDKHPRGGNPDNPGQFSKGRGTVVPDSKKPQRPRRAQEPAQQAPSAPAAPSPADMPKSRQQPAAASAKRPKGYESTPDEVFQRQVERGDIYGVHIPAGKYPVGDPRNDPEYEKVAGEKEVLSNRYVDANPEDRAKGLGGPTDELFDRRTNPKTGADNGWDPQREEMHHQILRDYFQRATKNVPKEGKCLVMAGPSGAGKSTFLKQQGSALGVQLDSKGTPVNYAVVNPDDFKEFVAVDMARYPGLSENETAGLKHEESSYLAQQATEMLMSQGYNVIMDVTLGNAEKAVKKYVEAPYAAGYSEYQVALVDGDMANSRQNAGNRYKQTDKATGERRWSGRFIPMSLVETQAPKNPGYRSINAEEFVKFSTNPKVGRAVVFDPYDTKAGLQEAKAAIREAIRRNPALASMLRVEGGRLTVPEQAQTTEITTKIQQFKSGQIDKSALVKFLTEDVDYKPTEKCPHDRGTPQWYRWHEEGRPYVPGSFDEVRLARNAGVLPLSVYKEISQILWKGSEPE